MWLGHRDFTATLIYADYASNPHEAELAFRATEPKSAALEIRDG